MSDKDEKVTISLEVSVALAEEMASGLTGWSVLVPAAQAALDARKGAYESWLEKWAETDALFKLLHDGVNWNDDAAATLAAAPVLLELLVRIRGLAIGYPLLGKHLLGEIDSAIRLAVPSDVAEEVITKRAVQCCDVIAIHDRNDLGLQGQNRANWARWCCGCPYCLESLRERDQ